MLDQYGNKVPDDLVILPPIQLLTSEDIDKIIMTARWYEINKYIIVASAREIDNLSDDTFENAVGDEIQSIQLVSDVLKRYSLEDGFYHA